MQRLHGRSVGEPDGFFMPCFWRFLVDKKAEKSRKMKKNAKKMQKNAKKFAYMKKKQYLCTVKLKNTRNTTQN